MNKYYGGHLEKASKAFGDANSRVNALESKTGYKYIRDYGKRYKKPTEELAKAYSDRRNAAEVYNYWHACKIVELKKLQKMTSSDLEEDRKQSRNKAINNSGRRRITDEEDHAIRNDAAAAADQQPGYKNWGPYTRMMPEIEMPLVGPEFKQRR